MLWRDRQIERQGPLTAPGLITSPKHVPVPDTKPGPLKAPTYDCASIAYFKMVDADAQLCFLDNYQLGLNVLVMAEGRWRMADVESGRVGHEFLDA